MNRRQFLTCIPMIGAAIVAAPAVAAAMAVKPEFAMGGTLTPGEPYMVGESVGETILTPDQVRKMVEAWESSYGGIPTLPTYYLKFDTSVLLRGDAKPHQA